MLYIEAPYQLALHFTEKVLTVSAFVGILWGLGWVCILPEKVYVASPGTQFRLNSQLGSCWATQIGCVWVSWGLFCGYKCPVETSLRLESRCRWILPYHQIPFQREIFLDFTLSLEFFLTLCGVSDLTSHLT